MTYNPRIAVINSRQVAENVLSYIVANQADAILWANGAALKPIKKFSDSVANRLVPVFPSMFFSDDNDSQDFSSDVLQTGYAPVFEVNIQNSDPNEAVRQARKYWQAIASLMANQPNASLIANTGATDAELLSLETGFLQIKSNELQNDFLQTFQIRATYALYASSHEGV